nr:unnamed protein product [Digitaria exilis]
MTKALPFPAVQSVCLWALLTACVFAVSVVFGEAVHIPCGEGSWFTPCIEMTDAALATADATYLGMRWCAVAQAAAAAVALLLPARRRRSRRALAYAALAAAAAGHYMYASLTGLLLDADPGYVFLRISGATATLVFAAGDLVCLLALLLGEDD